MLRLRSALKTALGPSLAVSHKGLDAVTRNLTVPVVDQGTKTGEETSLPCVQIMGEYGNKENAAIGGGAEEQESFVDIHILTAEGDNGEYDPPRLAEDIHVALDTAVRAVRKSLGTSYFTIASSHRDFPPRQTEAGPFWFIRHVMVRGEALEAF